METSFTLSFIDFKRMLAEIKRLVPQSMNSVVKIVVQPHSVEFSFPGVERTITATTENYCDALVPFSILYSLSMTLKTADLKIHLKDGEIRANSTTIDVKRITVQSLFSNMEIPLAINHNKADILRLRRTFTVTKLEELKLDEKLYNAERDLEEAIFAAYPKLNPYGISLDEFQDWVRNRIYTR